MFKITPNGPNRIDIEFSGKLDHGGMKAVLDELASKTHGIEGGRVLYRIGDFQFPTAGAIGVELSRLPQLFGLIRRFERAALVADKRWLRKFAEFEGKLLPGFELKAFEWDELDKAEAWLAETASR